MVIENILEGDELRTDIHSLEGHVKTLGEESVLCVLTTTSCFAPRTPDKLATLSQFMVEQQSHSQASFPGLIPSFPGLIPRPHSLASFPGLIPRAHSQGSFPGLIPRAHSQASFPGLSSTASNKH